jgi:predicted phosphodiesterase
VTVWALVSDVHGNLRALQQAEQLARAEGADRFIALGDIIGRGDPNGCVAWVRDNATIAIVGNRDLDYLERVTPELQAVVLTWANEAAASDFVVSHGDPKLHRSLNSRAVRDGFRRVTAVLDERHARVWFFGHTHRARCWELEGETPRAVDPASVMVRAGCRYVVNVGTTGLPLPGRGGTAFVLYDDRVGRIRSLPLDVKLGRNAEKPYAMILEAMPQGR